MNGQCERCPSPATCWLLGCGARKLGQYEAQPDGSITPVDPDDAAEKRAKWTNTKMNPWMPDDNPKQGRRLGKTGEEVAELAAVLFRISIQGIDSIDPSSGKTNRQRLLEESADVAAQLYVNLNDFFTAEERDFILGRIEEKMRQMGEWEAHYEV